MDYFSHGGDIYTHRDVLDFSANMNPLGIPVPVKEALLTHIEDISVYPDFLCRDLNDALVSHEEYAGFLKQDEIIWGNGASELIFALVQAIRPKRALIVAPAFSEYERALQMVHADISYYFLEREKKFVLDDAVFTKLEDMEKPDMLWICNPSNPVGSLIGKILMKEIADYCKRHKIYLVLDECFMDLVYDKKDYTLREAITENPYLFVLNAFTKSYALPGLRIGFGISSDEKLLGAMRESLPAWNISVMAQRAGFTLLTSDLKEYRNNTVEYLKQERKRLEEKLSGWGCETFSGAANFIFFHDTLFEKEGRRLGEQLLQKNILIRSCENYRGLINGDYRIAIRNREDNDRLLEAGGMVWQKN